MSESFRFEGLSGTLINRGAPLTFEFEGKSYQGYEGDTLASALLANGQWIMSRSFKYHRPRGPLTLAGQDANTLVQLGGEPNVLADRQLLSGDESVTGQNYVGSLENDRDSYMNMLGRFLPVGFYYRSFFRPLGIWDTWEKLIRKKAGLGVADLNFQPEYYDKKYLFHDVAVIGAGAAGLAAALTAANAGAKVLLVEENTILGGALSYHQFTEKNYAEDLFQKLVVEVESHQNIDVLLNATCNAWFVDNYLPIIQGKRMFKARAKQCIVTTGSLEQHVVFRNNDLPGIVMSSAAERMIKLYGICPGKTAVVLAGNDHALNTALMLNEYGVDVKAVIDMRAEGGDKTIVSALLQKDIPYKAGHTVYEALGEKGNKHIKAVDVRPIVAKGEVGKASEIIDCDLLCMSSGFMPTYQLLCQAGGKLVYDDEHARFRIENLPKNLHIAGAVNSIHGLKAVVADGTKAALTVLNLLELSTEQPEVVECSLKTNFDWPIFKHPKGKDFVDYDEDLQVKDIINATRIGYRDVQLVKRYSTVGMGPSQGRHSALPTARLVAKATDRSVTETGVTTARPPFAPEKLAHIAGRGFSPSKHTPMHQRHLELGGQMINVGGWQRPAFYGTPEQRKTAIQDEAKHVRNQVGIMDVSTLGGIDVRGPDAVEFLNRIYTVSFTKQPINQTRYAMMVNEHGVVSDDGIAARLAEDYFYLSATTSGVDRVYRDMKKWNAQWRLDVDIANVTSAFAKVNVAGPDARKVLEGLTNDIDLSAEAFPYLAYREGSIAGIPARVLRVGFVGELSFEIHVPARFGEALWDVIMEAGKPFNLKPFGVSSQRILRLEKGHFLISQDTDGMTHPGEIDMTWALKTNKPFFVGNRSVDIVLAQQQKRKLVAFTLPTGANSPEEGHLVLKGDNISGNVTSCEYSPSLDLIIGLAYAAVDQSEVGGQIPIRVDGGVIVNATVVDRPFYDPSEQRQEL
jgi:sarcosine oxidase subunit alpha